MATKQNMYVGISKESEKILNEIDNCIGIYKMEEDGFKRIVCYHVETAKAIRDNVSNMQGKIEILIKGLDKESPKRKNYEYVLKRCNDFLERTKR